MQKPTHINVGATTTLGLIYFTGQFHLYYLFYVFISLLPDLDHHQGSLTKKLHIRLPFKHRGFTHTLIAMNLVAVFLYFINLHAYQSLNLNTIGVEGLRAYLLVLIFSHTHLLGDIFTVSGLPYFWPVIKNFKIPGISIVKTGSAGEWIFNLVISIINILLMYLIVIRYNIMELTGLKEVQTIVHSNYFSLAIVLGLFSLLCYHIISTEIRYIKKDSKKMVKKVLSNTGESIKEGLIIGVLTFLPLKFLIPYLAETVSSIQENLLIVNTVIVSIGVIIFIVRLLQIFKKDLEFISKTLGYMVNIFFILVMSIIVFFGQYMLSFLNNTPIS